MTLLQCCHPVLDPNADPAVVGLAVGLGVCGALLIWVLVVAISAIIGVLK